MELRIFILFIYLFIYHKTITKRFNFKGCSSTDQVLNLFFRGYQFECHKPQGHWRLTWSLTSGSREISQSVRKLIRTSIINKKINNKETF